jgi:hypothetical protein
MGEAIAARAVSAADGREGGLVHLQPITDIIQAQRVGGLGIEHRHQMTPRIEPPSLLLHFGFRRHPHRQMPWNQIAHLLKNRQLGLGWIDCFFYLSAEWQRHQHLSSHFSVGR